MTPTFRKPLRLLKFAVYVITYIGLLGTAAVAVRIGIQDVFLPVSLSAQFVGLSYLLAGVAGLTGAVLLICKTNILWQECKKKILWQEKTLTFDNWEFVLTAGIVAGLYVDITIALYSFRYERVKAYIFAALALSLLGLLAFLLLSEILSKKWGDIDKSLAGAGVLLTLLAVAAQFWYQSVYLPESTQVGIEYSLSVGPVVQSGSNRFVTLRFTMVNVSSVAADELNSMLIVTGLSYANGTNSGIASPAVTQRNMIDYAKTLPSTFFHFSSSKLPDIGFSGHPVARTLAAWRPIGNNTLFFPNATFSRDFVVVIPERGIRAIDARVKIIYARAARLTPGPLYKPQSGLRHYPHCKNSEQFAYHIEQSALRRFTNGSLIFVTNWCADITHPDIKVRVTGIPDMNESHSTASALFAHYGVTGNTHIRTFVLGPATDASP